MRALVIVASFFFLSLTANLVAAPKAFKFTCEFMEKLGDAHWQVVDSRHFAAPLDSTFQFSMGNFSYRLTAIQLHDTVVQIESQVNCQAFPSRNFYDQNVLFKGAALFYDSALVRRNSVYRIKLVFDSIGVSHNRCDYSFGDSTFSSDPSGDFDFYFIKNSLGDYHWNAIRDAFERDYDALIERFRLTDRTKTNFFICPCPLKNIGWDDRWGNGYDYSRHSVFAQYDHGANFLEPEVVYMMRLMRIYGYAPAFILEGIAASFEYCEVWACEAYKNKTLPDITTFGESGKYRALDRDLSANAAGSFVNYIYNTRGRGKLIDWYQQSTDLTMTETFAEIYGKPMSEVAAEWHQYLDTLTLTAANLRYYSSRAQSFMHYPEMMVYAEKAYAGGLDSIWAAQTLSSLHYTYGDYKQAAADLEPLLRDTSTVYQARVFYANMLLAMGKVDSAEVVYNSSQQTDSTLHLIYYKLGMIQSSRGNYPEALKFLRKARDINQNPAFGVDYDIALGDAFSALKQADSATACYQRAINDAKILVGSFSENSLHHLRVGKAAVRLKAPTLAAEELELALFLEERMFYIGQILLAKGELLDMQKDRKAAIAQYKQVVDLPTGYLEKQLARKYLKTPYQN